MSKESLAEALKRASASVGIALSHFSRLPLRSDRRSDPGSRMMSPRSTEPSSIREQIAAAAKLMAPGGGSLETTAACKALYAICVAQQDAIEQLADNALMSFTGYTDSPRKEALARLARGGRSSS